MKKQHGSLALQPKGPVMFRVINSGVEGSLVEMGIDYSRADIPDRAYYSDYCDIVKDRFGFTLVFGKLRPGTSLLRTKIEIAFPSDMFLRQLWGTSRDFHRIVRKMVEKLDIVPPIENATETDKVQTFRANNVFMGVWTEEAVADFYYISPRDMHLHMNKRQQDITLEPIVRVVMGTALILEFLDKCGTLIPENALEVANREVGL